MLLVNNDAFQHLKNDRRKTGRAVIIGVTSITLSLYIGMT